MPMVLPSTEVLTNKMALICGSTSLDVQLPNKIIDEKLFKQNIKGEGFSLTYTIWQISRS